VPENLADAIRAVKEQGAELAIAFDGDADRIGVVDADGRIIWGDELLVVYGRDVLSRNPGATIVSEVKCSQRLYDDIAKRGGKGIMWKAGALAPEGEDARDGCPPRRRDERAHLLQGALLRLRRRDLLRRAAPRDPRPHRGRRSRSSWPTCRRRTPRPRSGSTARTT
jgi:hypothetical protein